MITYIDNTRTQKGTVFYAAIMLLCITSIIFRITVTCGPKNVIDTFYIFLVVISQILY